MGLNRRQQQIAEGIRQLITTSDEIYSGVVKSVNETDATMEVYPDPENKEFVLPVMLRSSVNGLKGIVLIPKVGTEITYASIEGAGRYTIVNAAELDKVLIDVPEIKLTCDKVVINGGDNGELVKIKELEDNLKSIKDFAEAIHAALPGAFDAILASTSANGALGKAKYQLDMLGKKITVKGMKNPKVKH